IQQGLNSRQRILGQHGLDFEEVIDDLAKEKAMLEDRGLYAVPEQTGELTISPDSQGAGSNNGNGTTPSNRVRGLV
ncbi:hypothetical protein LCGC14_3035440, partial [marine sediment metagenome]